MHEKQKTYLIIEGQKTLVQEETYNENNCIIHSINHEESPPFERNFNYDENGQIIFQNEEQGGFENSARYYEFNDEGELIHEKLHIGGKLYEEIVYTKLDSGADRVTFQDGEEVERMETREDGKNRISKFYQNDVLIEKHDYTYNSNDRSSETIIDLNYGENVKVIKKYNKDGEVIFQEEYNASGSLLLSMQVTFENGLVTEESIHDYLGNSGPYVRLFDYDSNNNLINFEVRSLSGALQSFHKRNFDDNNRPVEETGFTNGFFSGITGAHVNHDRFHIVHEYEDIPID